MKTFLVWCVLFIIIFEPLKAQTTPINEQKFIAIGGLEQWVTIKGHDRSKPVILFLHGGPGSVMSPYDDAIYGEWKKDFVLVNWDQRGAGRTFGRNAPEEVDEVYWSENPLTVELMTADGIELSEYLVAHLGKQKIILVGTSWGSILGTKMALKRPELFYTYVGHAQMVNPAENLVYDYHKIYKMAKSAKDEKSMDILEDIGLPPYDSAKNAGQLFRVIKKYERENSRPPPDSWWKLAPEYDNEIDGRNRYNGDDYSFINFVGHKNLGIEAMNTTIDFMKDGLEFKIPVYLVQGEEDILTPKEITKDYFDKIRAPKKDFFLLPDTAHGHNQYVVDKQYEIVKEHIAVSTEE